jgi:DNA-binding transcriptional regulator LsrR (DeoR family)
MVRQQSRDDLLALVASLYYEQDCNQQEIAERLHLSRSNISRMIQEAKAKGIVEVRVRKPIYRAEPLEHALKERFGLVEALVLDSMGRDSVDNLPGVGQLAARYLEHILKPHTSLAISWGTGVHAAVHALTPMPELQVDVVQMLGSVGSSNQAIDGTELARRLAELLGGRYYYLHAPVLVENPTVRDMLIAEATIQETLDRARKAAIALVGVGTTEAGANSFVRAGHLTELQLSALRAQGAVGEISGQHFDIDGNPANLSINRRVIGIDLEAVTHIPIVIGVARGLPKAKAILAALRGRFIRVLATDDVTAAAILEHDALTHHSGQAMRAGQRQDGA